jgi:DNA-binding MarR family transcriptional regulator
MPRSNTTAKASKRRPDQPEQKAYLNLLQTMNILVLQTERLLKRQGLSESTHNVLDIVRRGEQAARQAGQRFPGLPCSAIAGQMIAEVPDLTRLLDRLSRDGLVQRRHSQEDRRVVHVRLTAKGRRVMTLLDRPLVKLRREQLGHLSRKDLADLARLLAKARAPHED